MNINDKELARIYFDHHAQETDRRSQRRLTQLMRQAAEHAEKCVTEGCPVNLHAFLAGDVVQHTMINDAFTELGLPEDDGERWRRLNQHTFLRVYFPQVRQAYSGTMVDTKTISAGGRP